MSVPHHPSFTVRKCKGWINTVDGINMYCGKPAVVNLDHGRPLCADCYKALYGVEVKGHMA